MRKLTSINGNEKSWCRQSYVLWFGACAPTYLLVYANGLESALETAAEWLAENAPGHVVSDAEHTDLCREACEDAGLAWPMPEDWSDDPRYLKAIETAEADLSYTEAGWLTSYEWGIALECPTKQDLIAFCHD